MTRFERWSVVVTSALTTLTGLGYFWVKYLVQTDAPWAVINHPLEPWLLKAHILVAPLLVFAVGLIALRHVWRHLRGGERSGRRSGLVLTGVFGPLVVTGYLIQVVTAVGWLRALALAHVVLGVVFAAGLLGHRLPAARARREPDASARGAAGESSGRDRVLPLGGPPGQRP